MRNGIEIPGGGFFDDELPERTREADREDLLRELISIPRLEILGETEDSFEVKLGGETFQVIKSSETSFSAAGAQSQHLSQRLEMRQVMLPDASIFQDEEVREEFKEVMILHEIREKEYKEAGFQDAHKRAMQDEVLYILKYFKTDLQQAYLEFARKYREAKQKEAGEEQKFGPRLDEVTVDQLWHYFFSPGPDWIEGYLEQHRPSGIILSKLRSDMADSIRLRDKETVGTVNRRRYEELLANQQSFLRIFLDYLAKYKQKEF
jgi:hypothetical protein